MTPLMSIAGGIVQERKMAVELRLDPVNPCGGALGAMYNGDKACSVRELCTQDVLHSTVT